MFRDAQLFEQFKGIAMLLFTYTSVTISPPFLHTKYMRSKHTYEAIATHTRRNMYVIVPKALTRIQDRTLSSTQRNKHDVQAIKHEAYFKVS